MMLQNSTFTKFAFTSFLSHIPALPISPKQILRCYFLSFVYPQTKLNRTALFFAGPELITKRSGLQNLPNFAEKGVTKGTGFIRKIMKIVQK